MFGLVVSSRIDQLLLGAFRCVAELRVRGGLCLSSGVGGRLDDALPEAPLEVAVDVEPQRLEPGVLRPLRRTPEQLEEILQRGWKLAVGGQRHLVDI